MVTRHWAKEGLKMAERQKQGLLTKSIGILSRANNSDRSSPFDIKIMWRNTGWLRSESQLHSHTLLQQLMLMGVSFLSARCSRPCREVPHLDCFSLIPWCLTAVEPICSRFSYQWCPTAYHDALLHACSCNEKNVLSGRVCKIRIFYSWERCNERVHLKWS